MTRDRLLILFLLCLAVLLLVWPGAARLWAQDSGGLAGLDLRKPGAGLELQRQVAILNSRTRGETLLTRETRRPDGDESIF